LGDEFVVIEEFDGAIGDIGIGGEEASEGVLGFVEAVGDAAATAHEFISFVFSDGAKESPAAGGVDPAAVGGEDFAHAVED